MFSLFHRHARGLILTEQGDLLYKDGARRIREIETASKAC